MISWPVAFVLATLIITVAWSIEIRHKRKFELKEKKMEQTHEMVSQAERSREQKQINV